MALDDFIDDAKSDNSIDEDSFGSLETPICPSCETEGESTDHWYNRCTTPLEECETITFI